MHQYLASHGSIFILTIKETGNVYYPHDQFRTNFVSSTPIFWQLERKSDCRIIFVSLNDQLL